MEIGTQPNKKEIKKWKIDNKMCLISYLTGEIDKNVAGK